MKQLSIYIHIPFCVCKCNYCDFLSFSVSEETKERYVEVLCAEIRQAAPKYAGYEVQTVFFGGGTPSILKTEQFGRVISVLRENYVLAADAEISMEANPGTVDETKLTACRKMGFNRLSIGLQSARDEELLQLGRIHTYEMFLEAYDAAVSAGFSNINIDLMSALPGQSVESYRKTLEKVLSLSPRPTHISAYSLIVEEGTPFYEREQAGTLQLPSEDEEREMYELTGRLLAEHGYERYEISNYALPGFACRHNLVYWNRGDYVGFGLGAASLVDNVRFCGERKMQAYFDRVKTGMQPQEKQMLSVQEQMEEFMFLGLRLTAGVSKASFFDAFGCSMESVYGEVLAKHEADGLLVNGDFVKLTKKGLDVSNYVMSDFIF